MVISSLPYNTSDGSLVNSGLMIKRTLLLPCCLTIDSECCFFKKKRGTDRVIIMGKYFLINSFELLPFHIFCCSRTQR